LSQIDPVGGLVTGTEKPLFLHEGLQQNRAIAIDRLPMIGEGSGYLARIMDARFFDWIQGKI
jgi:hypothetical protein